MNWKNKFLQDNSLKVLLSQIKPKFLSRPLLSSVDSIGYTSPLYTLQWEIRHGRLLGAYGRFNSVNWNDFGGIRIISVGEIGNTVRITAHVPAHHHLIVDNHTHEKVHD